MRTEQNTKIEDFKITFNAYGNKTFEEWYAEAFEDEAPNRHKLLTQEAEVIQDMVHDKNYHHRTSLALKTLQDFLKENGKDKKLSQR